MSLEEKIGALIAALEQNTNALLNGPDAPTVQEESEDTKPETAKQKKARLAKEKKDAKAVKTTMAANGGKVTVESVKAQAKKIALTSDDPKECMNQIREIVSVVAESCYENANVGLDKFDTTGLILLQEELVNFVYSSPEPKTEKTAADDMEI